MSRLINWALTDLMLQHGELVVMGEDVGRKGGVYRVTQKLRGRFGADRVIDTLLDEQSILGLAIGLAHNGFIADPGNPVPRLCPQRRGPDPRRGVDAAVLLQRPIYQSDGRAHRGPRLSKRVWRALS